MKQAQQQRTSPPAEYWCILAIALHASGLVYFILFIVGLYFLFKRLQSAAGFTLLAVTSILVGMAVAQIYQLVIVHPESYSFLRISEPVFVSFVAIALLFTQKRAWAWVLIIYCALGALLWFILTACHFPKAPDPRSVSLGAVLSLVELWLLSSWLRAKPHGITMADVKSSDTDVIRGQQD